MFKKKLISAAAVALLASGAFAQMNIPSASVTKPAVDTAAQPAPAPVALATVEAPKADAVNPFMGKTLSLEARQRELETAKMETALLEERIKQAALSEDLKTLPLKKSVEAAQATTARMKEEAMQKDSGKPGLATPTAAAPAPVATVPAKPKTRPVKKAAVKEDTQKEKPAVQAAPTAPKIEVTSVLSLGGVRSAVLELDGNILMVKHGDSTPFGMVEVLDTQSVRVGGRVYKVHGATLARITISDPKPVDPKAAGAATTTPVSLATGAPTTPPQATFPSNQPTRVGAPTLPPLQLPSGVTIIPPTSR